MKAVFWLWLSLDQANQFLLTNRWAAHIMKTFFLKVKRLYQIGQWLWTSLAVTLCSSDLLAENTNLCVIQLAHYNGSSKNYLRACSEYVWQNYVVRNGNRLYLKEIYWLEYAERLIACSSDYFDALLPKITCAIGYQLICFLRSIEYLFECII